MNNTIASLAFRTKRWLLIKYPKDFFRHPQSNTLSDINSNTSQTMKPEPSPPSPTAVSIFSENRRNTNRCETSHYYTIQGWNKYMYIHIILSIIFVLTNVYLSGGIWIGCGREKSRVRTPWLALGQRAGVGDQRHCLAVWTGRRIPHPSYQGLEYTCKLNRIHSCYSKDICYSDW